METTMKIKDDVDFWNVIEESIQKRNWSWFNQSSHPINRILELEDTDFLQAIELCRKHKKYNLKKQYEEFYSEWKMNANKDFIDEEIYPGNFLGIFIRSISYARKHKEQGMEIKKEVLATFKEHNEILSNIEKLNLFLKEVKHIESEYFDLEKKWENNCAVLEKLNALKAQGVTPQDFPWNMLEEADEE
jgi:hypothetical protein